MIDLAFEITQDDVFNVLSSYNVEIKDSIESIMEVIDDVEISSAALSIDFDESEDNEDILFKQTEAAYDEIAWQLYQAGFIQKSNVEKYGNINLLTRIS